MKKIILMFSLMLASINIFAAESIITVLANLEESDKHISTLKFDISQEIHYLVTNEKQLSSGEVIFRKPGKMYYKQNEPIEQVIVTNSKKVWIYVKPYNQVISDSWARWTKSSFIPKSLLNFSNNWDKLKKTGEFRLVKEDEVKYIIELIPSKSDEWRMEFWISKTDFLPIKTVLSSESIRITTNISKYNLNPPVENSVFEFKSPKGAEIINN